MTQDSAGDGESGRAGAGGSSWRWLSPTLQTAAAVGAISYATIHVSYQNFYDAMHVTPEQVGASSSTILADSSLRVIEFGALFALLPVLIVLWIFLAVERLTRGFTSRSRDRRLAARVIAAGLACGGYVLFQLATDGRTYGTVVVASFAILAGFAYARRERASLGLAGLRDGFGAVVLVLWLGFAVAWTVITSLADDAAAAGRCARAGFAVEYVHTHRHIPFLARIPVLRIQAEPALIGRPAARNPHTRLLYLGASGGTAILWDATHGHAVLLPSSQAIVLGRSGPLGPRAACAAHVS